MAAFLLTFFLSGIGAGNFYLGQTTRGIFRILGPLATLITPIPWVGWIIGGLTIIILFAWWVTELIFIATGSGGYDKDSRGVPLKS